MERETWPIRRWLSLKRMRLERCDNPNIRLDEDVRLMLMAAQDDKAAYGRLYRKYMPLLTDYIVNLDGQYDSPEDLAQEVFIRIWENRTRYRPTAPFRNYLFGYVRNILQENKSKSSRKRTLDINRLSNFYFELHRPDVFTQNGELIESLKRLIAELPEKQKQTFELVYISGLSPKKAAEINRCSVHSVHNNLYRARKKLCELVLRE